MGQIRLEQNGPHHSAAILCQFQESPIAVPVEEHYCIGVPANSGATASDPIVDVILAAFRSGGGTPGGIQFKRPRHEDGGVDRSWDLVNCFIDFTYDRVYQP